MDTVDSPAGTARDETDGEEWPHRRSGWRATGARLAGLALLGTSAVVGCRAAGIDAITPVPQLLAFLPWLLAPAGFALLLAALARWRAGLVWALVVLGALAWNLRPYGPDPGAPDTARGPLTGTVDVLTANLQFGRATDDLIASVRREKPDLVYVQECAFVCADALRAELPHSAYPYRDVIRKDGSEGSAILSAFPLLAAPAIPGTMAMPGAVARIHGVPVRVQLAHPMPPLPRQVGLWERELGRLRAFAAADGTATILAGDFNASQDHAAFRRILNDGSLQDSARLAGHYRTPSWPAGARLFSTQIDHVLVSKDFTVASARFVPLRGSDHRGLLVRLEMHART